MLSLQIILSFMITYVTSKACHNSETYLYSNSTKLTCRKIRFKEERRQLICKNEEVQLHCPQTCGLCCDDSREFSFSTSFGTLITCSSIGNSTTLQHKYCDTRIYKSMVRNECPKACNFCKKKVASSEGNVIDEQTDENEIEQTDGNQDEAKPTFDTTSLSVSLGASAALLGLYIGFKRKRGKWKEGVVSKSHFQNDDKKVETYQQQLISRISTLKLQEEELGKDHVHNAELYYDIGILRFENGDSNAALESFVNALKVLDTNKVQNHPNVAAVHYMMGKTYQCQNKYKKATNAYKKALNIDTKLREIEPTYQRCF